MLHEAEPRWAQLKCAINSASSLEANARKNTDKPSEQQSVLEHLLCSFPWAEPLKEHNIIYKTDMMW